MACLSRGVGGWGAGRGVPDGMGGRHPLSRKGCGDPPPPCWDQHGAGSSGRCQLVMACQPPEAICIPSNCN